MLYSIVYPISCCSLLSLCLFIFLPSFASLSDYLTSSNNSLTFFPFILPRLYLSTAHILVFLVFLVLLVLLVFMILLVLLVFLTLIRATSETRIPDLFRCRNRESRGKQIISFCTTIHCFFYIVYYVNNSLILYYLYHIIWHFLSFNVIYHII